LIRKAVKELILSEKKSVKASADSLADYLGVPKYRYGEVEDRDQMNPDQMMKITATKPTATTDAMVLLMPLVCHSEKSQIFLVPGSPW
jgi:hypothetical protein